MALCVSSEHFIPNLDQFRRRRTTTPINVRASSLLLDHSSDHHHCLRLSVKCINYNKMKKNYNLFFLCCCCCSSNPKPPCSSASLAPKKSKNLKTLLGLISSAASAAAAAAALIINNISNNSGGGNGGGGWNRGGGGGGGRGGDGNGGDGFWSRIFFLSAAIDKELEEEEDQLAEKDISDHDDADLSCSSSPAGKNQEWVVFHHGRIPAINMNIVFDQVFNKLMISTGLIKVTESIHLFDQYPWSNIINNDSSCSLLGVIEMLMPAVRSGHEIYRQGRVAVRHQLSEALWNSGGILLWFPDYKKPIWKSPESFRCISVGSLPEWGPFIDPDDHKIFTSSTTDHREKLEYYKSLARAYKMRMDKARPCLIPLAIQNEIFMKLKEGGKEVISPTTRSHLFKIMEDRVIKWYHDRSYACAYVVFFGESVCNAKEIVCEVFEGNISRLDIQFIDKLNNVCEEGNTQLALIKRQLPKVLQQGHLYHHEAAKKAIRNLNLLGLFSSIQMIPRSDKKNVGEIVLEIKLREYEQNKSEVTTTWDIVPAGQERRPTLASLQPSVFVTYVHRNLRGLNRSIIGSIASSSLLNPQSGDLQLEFEYIHPYLDGVNDPRDRTFHINFYPTYGKKSPVFPGIPGLFWIPPILVDRAGIKTYITENFNNHQSKFMYGLVMEMITTSRIEYLNDRHYITNGVDYYGPPTTHSGMGFHCYGPPTTLSGTGVDYRVVAQANIIRDNTKFVNGMTVGQRTMFQLDQGLGIGSKFPFFNRHQLTHTRFLQLKQVEEGTAGKQLVPPPVLVLHGHYGGCVGDLPGYDAFTLGGPNSVRGYSQGELGACRYMLEVAAELRIPVKNNIYVYAFAEHGNDLGSSKDVRGNPTQYYHRKGQGSSYGLGVKLMGQVRAEYAIDHNEGKGALFIQFGERF